MYVVGDAEIEAVARVIRAKTLFRYTIGDECGTFERRYAEYLGTDDVALAGSGTQALTAGLIGLGLGPGDEVIVPAHTYMATALAVLSVGAIPVLVDIDDTLTIDPDALRAAIGPHTRAVIPVHLWGTACDMGAIMAIAAEHDIFVLEDACQGVGGGYRGAKMGAIGHAGAFSFNYYKNMTAGEGGAIVSRDPKVMQRARCAIDPTSFYWTGRDEDFKPFSSNGVRANELQGAMLNVQLDRLSGMVEAMRSERDAVLEGTAHLAEFGLEPVRLNSAEDDVAAHVFFRLPSEEMTRRFIKVFPVPVAGLTGRHMYTGWDQILTRAGAHHPDMNPYLLPANAGLGAEYTTASFPVTLDLANRTLMVPTDPSHGDQDVADLIHNVEMATKSAAGVIADNDVNVRAGADVDLQKWDMKQATTR
jgi:dTDP-4-amino-4,6-dideoxygalactose transaminase